MTSSPSFLQQLLRPSEATERKRSRNLVIASLILGLIAIMCLGSILYQEYILVQEVRQWVLRTHEVRTELAMAMSDMKDVESGHLGFLLTGQPSYLEHYDRGLKSIHSRMHSLLELTSDNFKQRRSLRSTARIIDDKASALSKTIELRRTAGFAAALVVAQTDRGNRLMNELRAQFRSMEKEETLLLQQGVDALNDETDSFLRALLAFAAAVSLLLCAFGYFMRRYLNESIVAQRAVAEQKVLFSSVLNSLSDAVMVADASGKLVVVNPAAERLTGIKDHSATQEQWGQAYGCYTADGVTPYTPDQLPLVRAMRGESISDEEMYLSNPQMPKPIWISLSGAPLNNDAGISGAGVVVFRDVTMRKAAERRISEFVSTVSHELRTPLTSIKGALRIIEGGLAGELSARASSLIKIASVETERLIRLVNDILDLRKIEEGELELKIVEVEVRSLVTRAIQAVHGMASDQGILLEEDVLTQSVISCDEDRILQVIVNLLSNAIKFSPAGGTVKISADNLPCTVRLSVSDHGSGIADVDLPKLFGRFQQIDSSDSRQQGGSGLGLAISKAIVEQHHGAIGVESQLGQGSTFWFELPIDAKESSAEYAPDVCLRPILVIEDDPHLIQVLQHVFVSEGFSIIAAHSIAEANKKLQECMPEAILLDVNLPDGNGLDWLQQYREASSSQPVPVIVMTGHAESESARAQPLLIYDWLAKPFSMPSLSKALRYAVRKKGDEPAKVLIVEDNGMTRELLVGQLSNLGVVCIEAADGETAIELVRTEQPDLIILDIGLPGTNGYRVVDVLRSDLARSTPLIVYTSFDLSSDDKKQLTLGLSKHLVKSKTTDEQIVRAVRELLSGLISPKDSP